MRDAPLSRLVVLLGSTSLATLAFGQTQPVVAHATDTTGCPVLVSAKYVPGAALRPVGPMDLSVSSVSRQPLHLTFGIAGPGLILYKKIVPGPPLVVREAEVTVRGITEKGGVIPASVAPGTPWLEKKFTVDVATNTAGLLTSTVWLTGFGAVSDVRVDSITYTNGTGWTAPAAKSCHASMGPTLLSAK